MLNTQIDTEQLCSDVQQYLDLDPRYFDQNVGYFPWHGETVHYVRLADEFVLTVGGESMSCVRL